MTPNQLVGEIVAANSAAVQTFGKTRGLQNIILNCHGYPGGLWIGGIADPTDNPHSHSLQKEDLTTFGVLKPLNVGTIWIVSCDIAGGEKGQNFCQTLANVAGTQVIVSDESQEVTNWQGVQLALVWMYNNIDDYEGTVYSFTPAGGMRKGIDPERDVWTVKESG